MKQASCFLLALTFTVVPATLARAGGFALVEDGDPAAFIFAEGPNQWAGRRLADRVAAWSGVRVPVRASSFPPEQRHERVVAVGTPGDNRIVRELLADDPRLADLGDQGSLLTVADSDGRRVLLCAGNTLEGVNNAVSELVSWHLRLDDGHAAVTDDELEIAESPALKYRLLWNWTMGTHWHTRVADVYDDNPQSANYSPSYDGGAAGFIAHHKRAIDFFSDHKLNGLMIWHILHDNHGGIESARELMTHGKRSNVRIMPGIGTMQYNGYYSSGKSPYNMTQFLNTHPQVRRLTKADGEQTEMPCPSDPIYQKWFSEGAHWFFDTFPDVGGANVEHGDLLACHGPVCSEQRKKPGNDPNFFWDMKTTEVPLFEIAHERRPDAWMIFATYTSFMKEGLPAQRDITKAALPAQRDAATPPKFLDAYPPNAICQWTLTDLATAESWPEGVGPPTGAIDEHIGYMHQGGLRNCCPGKPIDEARWWAGPSAIGDDISEAIDFVCGRIHQTGMTGLAIYGEMGDVLPAGYLRYVAMEYFTWHPDRTYEQFIRDRLATSYGSEKLAREFLEMLRNTDRGPGKIAAQRDRAAKHARGRGLDARQRRRWRDLRDELSRRLALLAAQAAEQTDQ